MQRVQAGGEEVKEPPENKSDEAFHLRSVAADWGQRLCELPVDDADRAGKERNKALLEAALAYARKVTLSRHTVAMARKEHRLPAVIPEIDIARQRWKCKRCGRNKFTRPAAHRCNGQFRKKHLLWEIVAVLEVAP